MRALGLLLVLLFPVRPAVIGRSTPAEPLTEPRVMTLPAAQRGPWLEYLRRSEAQMRADRAALAKEREGMTDVPPLPTQGSTGRAMPLHRGPEFYASAEARRIGDAILSFQTPAGGWSKNLALDAPRQRGQSYAAANAAPTPGAAGDFDAPRDEQWHYIGTLDNDATNTELHFLAELSAALPGHEGDAYRASFLRGVEYLLHAQYPNGGWPQVWPLEGGYHDAVTFNDNAIINSVELLTRAGKGERVTTQPSEDELAFARMTARGAATPPEASAEDYTFVPAPVRTRAKAAVMKALDCILKAQLRVPAPDGEGTVLAVWGQQNDPLTLAPVAARNYEPASLSSGESADIMLYLMSLDRPSPAVVRSVDAAGSWFEEHKITGYTWSGGRNTPGGRKLTAAPGAGPLWARYYSLTTGKPIFGDRDKTIHDDVMDVSLERRNGYAWYGDAPARALKEYARWKTSHSAKAGV